MAPKNKPDQPNLTNSGSVAIPPETTFEQAFEALAEVVALLEEGKHSLDESLALFERGQQLAQFCRDRLEQAELRIAQISATAEDSGRSETPDDA